MKYSRSEALYNHRMAGRIRRLHIKPMNGDEQNIAAHSWGVTMILLDPVSYTHLTLPTILLV